MSDIEVCVLPLGSTVSKWVCLGRPGGFCSGASRMGPGQVAGAKGTPGRSKDLVLPITSWEI